MTESEWLASTDPRTMLSWLQGEDFYGGRLYPVSDRKLRLFACACHRYASVPAGEEALAAIAAAELWADGGLAARSHGWTVTCASPQEAAEIMAQCTGAGGIFAPARAALLRDIFGSPWRSDVVDGLGNVWHGDRIAIGKDALAWNDGTVVRLAQAIYAERSFDRLPILADALEEAGCDSADLLAHLRGAGPHACGCHVLDLILDRE